MCQTEQDPLPKSCTPHHLLGPRSLAQRHYIAVPHLFSLSSRSSTTFGKVKVTQQWCWAHTHQKAPKGLWKRIHIKKPKKVSGNEFPISSSSSFSLCRDKQLFMHAVYVLACTLQLTMFSLQCNLSKPDLLSLYHCGKLLNTVCSKQWAAVPAGNTMKHTAMLAAAVWHMLLLVIKSQTEPYAAHSSTSTLSLTCGSSRGSEMGCCDMHWLHVKKSEKVMTGGVATALQGPLPVKSSSCAISHCSFWIE